MLNKSTTNEGIKNSVFTPKDVKKALDNLPYNYILKVQALLQEKVDAGKVEKNYSKQWIIDVKKGNAFNEDIMEALIKIGLENFENKKRFGFKKRKTPST